MPYVARDKAGRIVAVHASQTDLAPEQLTPDDPALRAFLGGAKETQVEEALIASDVDMVRVLEDLIAVLIDKRIIVLTDLPKAAQEKLAHRYRLRSTLTDLQGIVGDVEDILLP